MKTKSEALGFWERIDERLAMRGMTLAEVCRQQGINYDSIISSKMRGAYPGTLTTHKIAKALRTSIESLLENAADNLYAAEEPPAYGADPLYELLSADPTLKATVWRIVQCNAMQLRTIGTMLTSWGVPMYDEQGEYSKQWG